MHRNNSLDWDRLMDDLNKGDLEREEKSKHKYHKSLQERELRQIRWAASDESKEDDIRDRIGAKFDKMCPISLALYSVELYVLDENSALLSFRKSGKIAQDLNGKTVDFYLLNENSTHVYETIEDGETVIDFRKLNISIENYHGVAFKIVVDDLTIIDGRLGNGKSS